MRTFSSGRSAGPDPGLPRRRGRRDGEELCGRRPPTDRGAGTGELRAHRTPPGLGVRKLDPRMNFPLPPTPRGPTPTCRGQVLHPRFLFSASILIRPFPVSLTPCFVYFTESLAALSICDPQCPAYPAFRSVVLAYWTPTQNLCGRCFGLEDPPLS